MTIRLPDDSQRLVIVGRTGSGKTQANMWHMSLRGYDRMPWIIFDYKGDEFIGELESMGAEVIDLGKVPSKPGLFITRPLPEIDDDHVERFLREIWSQGETGIMVDEGYMIKKTSPAFSAILTQGRSRRIPANLNTQRPTLVNRFFFSEADFFQLFHLNDVRDYDTIANVIPLNSKQMMRAENRLQDFRSLYYDVAKNSLDRLEPVPNREHILGTFRARLRVDEDKRPSPAASGDRTLRIRAL